MTHLPAVKRKITTFQNHLQKLKELSSREKKAFKDEKDHNLEFDELYWNHCLDTLSRDLYRDQFKDGQFHPLDPDIIHRIFTRFLAEPPETLYNFPPKTHILFGEAAIDLFLAVDKKTTKLFNSKDVDQALPALAAQGLRGGMPFGLQMAGARFVMGLAKKIKNKWNYSVGPDMTAMAVQSKGRSRIFHFFTEHYPRYAPAGSGELFLTSRGVLVLIHADAPQLWDLSKTRIDFDITGSFLIRPDQSFKRFRFRTHRWQTWYTLLSGLAPGRVTRAEGYADYKAQEETQPLAQSVFTGHMKTWKAMEKKIKTAAEIQDRKQTEMLKNAGAMPDTYP